jgi:hypothetical protein
MSQGRGHALVIILLSALVGALLLWALWSYSPVKEAYGTRALL